MHAHTERLVESKVQQSTFRYALYFFFLGNLTYSILRCSTLCPHWNFTGECGSQLSSGQSNKWKERTNSAFTDCSPSVALCLSYVQGDDLSSRLYSTDRDENMSGHSYSIIPQMAQLTAFSEI